MDTRKLTASETFSTGNEIVPEISFIIGTDSDFRVSVTAEMDEKDGDILSVAAELVKRWNAYPEAMELLRWVVQAATMQGPAGTTARILKAEVIARAEKLTEGLDLLTILRAKEKSEQVAEPKPYTVVFYSPDGDVEQRHCTASEPEKADHIADGNEVIAIYEGHLKNLVK